MIPYCEAKINELLTKWRRLEQATLENGGIDLTLTACISDLEALLEDIIDEPPDLKEARER